MPRGEKIGDAYIRVTADGTGLNRSIRDQFDDADGEFEKAGARNWKAYQDAFAKESSKPVNQRVLRESISNTLAKGDWLEKNFFKGQNWKQFRNSLGREFGAAGRLAGDNLEEGLARGMSFDQLAAKIADLRPELDRATKQIAHDQELAFRERDARILAALREEIKQENDLRIRQEKVARELLARRVFEVKRLKAEYVDLTALVKRMVAGEEEQRHSRRELLDQLSDLTVGMRKYGLVNNEVNDTLGDTHRHLLRVHPELERFRSNIDRLSVGVGATFGKGSRNNFINFFGSLASNIVKTVKILPNLIGKFQDLAFTISTSFTKAGGGLSGVFAGLGSAVSAGLPGLIALAAALAGLVVLVGPIIALFSALTGIVIALAGSITFALVGALGALAGALLPLTAGIGVAVAAVLSMDDKMKKALSQSVKPLTNAFKELGAAAARPIFNAVRDDAAKLAPVVREFVPLFREVGQAIGRVGDYFVQALQSPGFAAFRREMTAFLPAAVEALGKSFGNFVGGMAGVFRGLIPITQEFLGWLQRITGDFAEWANSKEGQEQLKRFFRDAADSVKSLGGFLESVKDLVVFLLDQGRATGDTIFDKMARGIQRFTQYLRDNPTAVKDFFANAQGVAEDIGRIISALSRLVDAFDNTGTRLAASYMLNSFAAAMKIISFAVEGTVNTIGRLASEISREWTAASTAAQRGVNLIVSVFTGIGARIGGAINNVRGIVTRVFNALPAPVQAVVTRIIGIFTAVPGRIASAVASIPGRWRSILAGLPGIAAGIVGQIIARFATTPGRFASAVAAIPGRFRSIISGMPGIAATIVSGIIARFATIPGRVSSALSGLGAIASRAFGQMVSAAASIPDRIAALFRGLAGKIIAAVGTIRLPTPTISMPKIPKINIPGLASGGIEHGLNGIGVLRRVGEDGPEAVVPLDRPLSQVDPAVRWLSALAQGKMNMANGGVVGSGKTIDASGWQIIVPGSDARAVAENVVNRLVATGY
jgi:phage-related protein